MQTSSRDGDNPQLRTCDTACRLAGWLMVIGGGAEPHCHAGASAMKKS
jgi:hypothetical protein